MGAHGLHQSESGQLSGEPGLPCDRWTPCSYPSAPVHGKEWVAHHVVCFRLVTFVSGYIVTGYDLGICHEPPLVLAPHCGNMVVAEGCLRTTYHHNSGKFFPLCKTEPGTRCIRGRRGRSAPYLMLCPQMSAARLWQLKALCMQYPGPVSAALYVGVLKGTVLHENGE